METIPEPYVSRPVETIVSSPKNKSHSHNGIVPFLRTSNLRSREAPTVDVQVVVGTALSLLKCTAIEHTKNSISFPCYS